MSTPALVPVGDGRSVELLGIVLAHQTEKKFYATLEDLAWRTRRPQPEVLADVARLVAAGALKVLVACPFNLTLEDGRGP